MDNKEKVLRENIKEYYEEGLNAFNKGRYNTATTLFFKVIVAACDLLIFLKEKITPSSHNNRFRILEDKYPEIYKIADRDFPFYQNSYNNKMSKEEAKLLKDDCEKLQKIIGNWKEK